MSAPAWLRRAALRALGAGELQGLGGGLGELLAIMPGASLNPMAYGGDEPAGGECGRPYRLTAGIAEFGCCGVLGKDRTFMRMVGLSDKPTYTEMAATVRAAEAADDVLAGMLYADSPGGTIRGLSEYVAALASFRARKPLHTFAETAGSAAYVAAAQAQRITMSLLGDVGSIGVIYRLLDASKAGELAGLRMVLVRSGSVKGAALEPLAGLSEAEIADFQRQVNAKLELMLSTMVGVRGFTIETLREFAATGTVYSSAEAQTSGLVDAVGTYGEAMAALVAAVAAATTPALVTLPEPATEEEEDDSEPVPPMPEAPQEATMATKPNAVTPAPGAADEERSFMRRLKGLLGRASAAAPEPESDESKDDYMRRCQDGGDDEATCQAAWDDKTAKASARAAGLSAAEVDARIEARFTARVQEQEVDADLRALAGKVTPAVLGNAETRALLLSAKAVSPERYKAALGLVAGDASAAALLGGPIADATHAGEAIAKTATAEMLARHGITQDRAAELERRYGLGSVN